MMCRAHVCWVHIALAMHTLGNQGPCSIVQQRIAVRWGFKVPLNVPLDMLSSVSDL